MKIKSRIVRALAALVVLAMGLFMPCEAVADGADSGAAEMGLKLVVGLLGTIKEATPEAAISAVVEWGVGQALDKLFGSELSSEEREYFEEILSQLAQLQDGVRNIQDTLDLKGLDDLINSFNDLVADQTPSVLYRALELIDEAEGTPEWKRQQRLSLLTDGIGAGEGNLADITRPFDQYTKAMLRAMTTPFQVSLEGRSLNLMLPQIQYEYLRRTYFWEHQAMDEWIGFQCRAMGLLVETLTIEKLSLQARLERIRQYNSEHPTSQIATQGVEVSLGDVQEGLNTVKKLYGEDNSWIAQPHPDDERYYWVPGHEMVFHAQVNTQSIPAEAERNWGIDDANWENHLKGISGEGSFLGICHPVWSFWKPFFRPAPTRLTTRTELENIFHDYELKGQRKSYYEIFFDAEEGNFQGLVGDESWDWVMVFDPESANLECHVHADPSLSYHYTVEAWFLDAKKKDSMPKPAKQKIAWYMYHNNHPTDKTCFIGLRLKTVNDDLPETGGTNMLFSGEELAFGWVPVDENLPIEIDPEVFGTVRSVEVDGAALSASDYDVTGTGVKVLKARMETLSEGLHTFVVRAENGAMTLTLAVSPGLGMALPKALTSLGDEAFRNVGMTSVKIDDACTAIGANAFADNAGLTWVSIPDSVTEIGDGAFANCPSLMLICDRGSAAEAYARENAIPFRYRAE